MSGWVLVPCLVALRREIDRVAPGRDRRSDGTIGDAAHQRSVSDHNDDEVGRVPVRDADSKHEVHALDVDADLRTPGVTMAGIVDKIVKRCRAGKEKRLTYIIFNRKIWSASRGWAERAYTGASPHTEHAHFSASYVTAHESDTSPWGIAGTAGTGDDMLIEQGDSGELVKTWQHFLNRLGFKLEVDGDAGPKTMAAIQAFRESKLSSPKKYDYLTGWTAFAMIEALAEKIVAERIAAIPAGKDGKNGKDGKLTGSLRVVGGTLSVESAT
jgi:hypothetical protein